MRNSIYLCSPKVYEDTISLPMIKFNRVKDSLDLSNFDTLIFTSKQAVVFTDEISQNWQDKEILAVGPATAKKAKELGAKSIYFPKKFYGETLAQDIIDKFKDKKILYIRPKVVSFDSRAFLQKSGIDIKEEIIYETLCVEYTNIDLEQNSIIIFTSPSTIECFFKNFKWDSSFKAVVIGKSTLKNLPQNIDAFVAKEPTISACVQKAKELL